MDVQAAPRFVPCCRELSSMVWGNLQGWAGRRHCFLNVSTSGRRGARMTLESPVPFLDAGRRLQKLSLLTLEWIDGIELTDAEPISKAKLNRKRMINEETYKSSNASNLGGIFCTSRVSEEC